MDEICEDCRWCDLEEGYCYQRQIPVKPTDKACSEINAPE
jgi:hypothetical protein